MKIDNTSKYKTISDAFLNSWNDVGSGENQYLNMKSNEPFNVLMSH